MTESDHIRFLQGTTHARFSPFSLQICVSPRLNELSDPEGFTPGWLGAPMSARFALLSLSDEMPGGGSW